MHFIVILFLFWWGRGARWALIRGWELKKYFFEGGVVGVGAYSRWALIRGWALKRINTVHPFMLFQMSSRNRGFVRDLISSVYTE